ncbi:class I SAM-dependent methyltransferase [Herbaspirillum sp. RV1423]|uniref:class I SAM-dependent methyltransferase n=1 Tax=Herbaspirillum sp. RV1423 TaxID=1443993 RepID=UPI0004B1DF8B|nr:class I SAM-dependent methyltransferase [Herbaspirillum sp. RV1423]
MTLGQRRSLLQAPAIQALIVLCLALILALLAEEAIEHFLGVAVSPVPFSFLHGALAAAIAYIRRMASWWVPILFFFPPAVVSVNALHLPPAIFLVVFLFLLLLFWSTFRSQVPFYPSGRPVWDAVARLLPADKPLRVIDIGSGLGGAVLHLSRLRPDSRFVGIELAPLPWLISQARARIGGSRGSFKRGDYALLDFADFDAIFAYLSPAAMSALWQKARAEMRPGTLLLSYEFIINEAAPDIVIHPQEKGPVLYGWRM